MMHTTHTAHATAARRDRTASTATFYHATLTTNVAGIMRDGLVPAKGIGGDEWVREHPKGRVSDKVLARKPAVYICDSLMGVEAFSAYLFTLHRGDVTILRVSLPRDAAMEPDTMWGHQYGWGNAYRYLGTIGPEHIAVEVPHWTRSQAESVTAESIAESLVRGMSA